MRYWLYHRVHILVEMKQGQCICPLSWSVHCNFTGEGKCNERGWACSPHPHQPGQILPSWLNVRQKAAVATLCTLWCRFWVRLCSTLLHIRRCCKRPFDPYISYFFLFPLFSALSLFSFPLSYLFTLLTLAPLSVIFSSFFSAFVSHISSLS